MKLGEKTTKTQEELGLTKTGEQVEIPGRKGVKAFVYQDKEGQAYVITGSGIFPIEQDKKDVQDKGEPLVPKMKVYTQTPKENIEEPSEIVHISEVPHGAVSILQGTPMLVNIEAAKEEWQNYLNLTKELLVDEDYQTIGNRRFKKKSAWRKYARFFNITDRILEEKITRDDNNRVLEAFYLVQAIAPNGRTAQGLGVVSRVEGNKVFNRDHDIISTAHTRAKNRAISDLIGAGEVSSEEVDE